MRPSVAQLLGWQPAQLTAAGSALLAQAAVLQRAEGELAAVGSGLSGIWTGQAADSASAHTADRAGETAALAETAHAAGLALQRAGQAIGAARAALQGALAAAATARATVNDDGTVTAPVLPPLPPAAAGAAPADLAALQASRAELAAHNTTVAAGLQQQVAAALTAAGQADHAGQSALAALDVPAAGCGARCRAR